MEIHLELNRELQGNLGQVIQRYLLGFIREMLKLRF